MSEWTAVNLYDDLVPLKRINPKLQILLSVGHVMGLPDYFFNAADNYVAQQTFAKNLLLYVRSKNLDGITLEWFHLANRTTQFFVKEKFQELLRAIKSEFEEEAKSTSNPKLTLAVTTAAHRRLIDVSYNVAEMAKLVDFLSIKTVDLRTPADGIVGPSASLYGLPGENHNVSELNVDWAVSYYQSLGVPAEKINIVIPTYGRSFTLVYAGARSVGMSASGDGHAGKLTGEDGIISHFEMCELIREGGSIMSIPHSRYYVKGTQWISYEDGGSVMQKACYVKEKHYGGVTMWTLDLDDFTGLGCNHGKYPLISAAVRILTSADDTLCASKIWENYEEVPTYTTKFPVRPTSENDLGSNRLVCYMTNWSRYRQVPAKFLPEDINPNICTHIIYAYAEVIDKRIIPRYKEEESKRGQPGIYSRVLKAKEHNPALKVLLSVGGDGAGTLEFERASETADSRRLFSVNAVRFLRDRGFDGLEVFWAYPTAETSANLKELLQNLRYAFDEDHKARNRSKLILATALTANIGRILKDYGENLVSIAIPTDFISLMTYDFHGKWDVKAGVNSPLFANENDEGEEATLNVDYIAQIYTMLGVPNHMINIGIPSYGVSFRLTDPRENGLGSPVAGPGNAGTYTGVNGMLAYYEVCKFIYSGARIFYVPSQKVRYSVRGSDWVGFEDADSVNAKACYAISSGFGGVSVWTLDLDDFNNICGFGAYPLVNAVNRALRRGSTACLR